MTHVNTTYEPHVFEAAEPDKIENTIQNRLRMSGNFWQLHLTLKNGDPRFNIFVNQPGFKLTSASSGVYQLPGSLQAIEVFLKRSEGDIEIRVARHPEIVPARLRESIFSLARPLLAPVPDENSGSSMELVDSGGLNRIMRGEVGIAGGRKKGVNQYIDQSGLEVPSNSPDKELFYGIRPKKVKWHSFGDEKVRVRKALLGALIEYTQDDFSQEFSMEAQTIWRFLFHHLPPPSQQTIQKFTLITGISAKYFYAYLFKNYFHELGIGRIAERQGHPSALFHIDVTYDAPLIRKFNETPGSLAEAVWLARKVKGLTLQEASDASGIADDDLYKIEKGELRDFRRLNVSLAMFLGVSLEEFHTKYMPKNEGVDFFTIGPERSKVIVRKAIGERTIAFVTGRLNRALAGVMREHDPIKPAVVSDLVSKIDRTIVPRVYGALLMALGSELTREERSDMWLGVHGDEIKSAIEGFDFKNPSLVVSDHYDLKGLFNFSVPEALTRMSCQAGYVANETAETLGFDSSRLKLLQITDNDVVDYSYFTRLAGMLHITPAHLYILFNPWVILALPVVTESGVVLNEDQKYPAQSVLTNLGSFFDSRRKGRNYLYRSLLKASEGIGLVQQAGEKVDKFYPRILEGLAFPREYWRQLVHNQGLPGDEALLYASEHIPGIDKKRLLESFRLGELSVFLGRDEEGFIDWSPSQLSGTEIRGRLTEVFRTIEEKLSGSFSKKVDFWLARDLFCFRSTPKQQEAITQGFTPRQIYLFCMLAREAGVEDLNIRDLYWYFNGDFLRQFIGEDQSETPSPSSVSSVNLPTAFPASHVVSASPNARNVTATPASKPSDLDSKGSSGAPKAMLVEGGVHSVVTDNLLTFPVVQPSPVVMEEGALALAIEDDAVVMPNALADEDELDEINAEPANNANYITSPQSPASNTYLAGAGVLGLFANPAVSFTGLGLPALPGVGAVLGR